MTNDLKMKYQKYQLFIFLFICYASYVSAQQRLMVFGGLGASKIREVPKGSSNSKYTYAFGGALTHRLGESILYRAGLQYVKKGDDYRNGSVNLDYIELEAGIQVGGNKDKGGLYGFIDLSAGGLVSARGRVPNSSVSIKELFNSYDLGINIGYGLRINSFFSEVNYRPSLLSIVKDDFGFEAYNDILLLKVGFSFILD